MANKSEFSGDYSLTSIILKNKTAEIDIKEIVSEISIYESVNAVSLSVEILVGDSKNIIASLPIQGGETVEITVSTKGIT